MDTEILHAITFLERVPAVEDIHVFETTYPDEEGTEIALPVTLWFDEFQYGASTENEDAETERAATETDKLRQLEAIMSAYLAGVTVSIHDPDEHGSGSHIVVLKQQQTWNPLSRIRRRLNALRWRWHVLNGNTHIAVTPLPLDSREIHCKEWS